MAKILCNSVRTDGSPRQGRGLKQFNGDCIAHASADLTRQWRSRGGKNSSTAARSTYRRNRQLPAAPAFMPLPDPS